MRSFLIVLFSICCSEATFAHLESTHYLQGHFGGEEVAVRIDDFNDISYLKYFFKREKKDVILRGLCDSTSCSFQLTTWDQQLNEETVIESLVLLPMENEDWHGIWKKGPEEYNVYLTPINKESVTHRFAGTSILDVFNPYSYVRTADMNLTLEEKEKRGRIVIQWMKEDLTGIRFFRIDEGLSVEKRQTTNDWLLSFHLGLVESYLGCGTYGHKGELESKITINYLGTDLISLSRTISSNCFSRMISTETEHFTVDTGTGKIIELENILWLGDSEPPPRKSAAWFEYRRNTFGKFILEQLKSQYPEKFEGEGCRYDDEKAWQLPTWYLTEKGIFIGAFLPGIDRTCDAPEWAVLPYRKIKKHLNKTYDF